MTSRELDTLCINTIRFLAVDAVEKAKSGHPGLPLGSATMAYVLWDRFLKFNPKDPEWPDRDRYILSAGHGSAMLYALLHLTGYNLPLEQLKRFRQLNSMTPGHPEYGRTPGVEATTGPLGQGISNAVGMAIAEAALAARFNREGFNIVDHHTFVEVSDGDIMEGVASEAASLAGHLRLGKLIVFYADNEITIEGGTDLAFSEDRCARFAAYGWNTQLVEDGNDIEAIHRAISAAKSEKDRPSFIEVQTHLGFGSPHKQDTASAHGEPLGDEEVRLTKQALGWPSDPAFYIPEEALNHFRLAVKRGKDKQELWQAKFNLYADRYPELAKEFQRVMSGKLPRVWKRYIPSFTEQQGPIATREVSGKVLNALASYIPELMGGAADLAPSTHTIIEGEGNFEAGNRMGRNLHFGIREHAMGAILNGMAYHKGLVPYGATFLIFSDYMRPPIRLAAMSHLHVIYDFTHDSIGLGEDGPTHQPVEQLLGLRAVPNLTVMRPADANEASFSWQYAIEHTDGPVALVLTRQKLPVLDPGKYPQLEKGVSKGAYILLEAGDGSRPDLIIIASGSEVHISLEAAQKLAMEGLRVRLVSMPSWNIFERQDQEYRELIILQDVPILTVEAGVTLGWMPYVGQSLVNSIGINHYGASAPGKDVMREYGFTADHIYNEAHSILVKVRNEQ
ncbi:MAG: transketolase [Ignavibacteriales bacterium]